jgi:PKD repeat protein
MKFITTTILALATTALIGQIHHCSTDEMHQKLYHDHPGISQKVIQNAQWLENFTERYEMSKNNSRAVLYTIPVVFHVIHLNGPENIDDVQILDQMRIINEDYQKTNADTANTITAFKSIAADCQIEFKLAQIDPDGNCTNGITRHFDSRTIDGMHDVKEIVHWDPTMYLNIYVCRGAAGLAGHAIVPAAADTIPEWDGIVIAHSSVGEIGTGDPTRSVVLTHEIGHYLNLQHIWGGNNVPGYPYLVVNDAGNCAYDDGVADTPETIGWSSCNLSHQSCGTLDNVQNFMEYAYCPTMLTEGQKQRMHATLNSPIAGRNNLSSPANLIATGVNNPLSFCKTDFKQDKIQVCAGESVQYTDLSFNDVSEWTWTFDGGTPTTSALQNPSIVYNTPGTYNVKLVSGDGINEDSLIQNMVLTVLPSVGTANSIIEGFEGSANINTTQFIPLATNGTNAWSINSQSGYNSNQSLMLNNFEGNEGEIFELTSELLDLTGISNLVLTFDYAFAKQTSGNTSDKLIVKVSTDCGATWSTRKSIAGSNLLTVTDSIATAFTPANDTEWKSSSVTTITSAFWTDNFRLKFEFENAGGNNFFIDNVNLYDPSMASINLLDVSNLRIFPNPAINEIVVTDNAHDWTSYSILNSLGQKLASGNLDNSNKIDVSKLSTGMYWISVADKNNQTKVKMFVKQ